MHMKVSKIVQLARKRLGIKTKQTAKLRYQEKRFPEDQFELIFDKTKNFQL